MIDFSKIEQYRENNRIEAKKALGGIPNLSAKDLVGRDNGQCRSTIWSG